MAKIATKSGGIAAYDGIFFRFGRNSQIVFMRQPFLQVLRNGTAIIYRAAHGGGL